MSRPARRLRDEGGYVTIVVAILLPLVFLGAAAVGIDLARQQLEGERIQRAADSAALAGVTFMPTNLPRATTAALANARLNGYEADDDTSITVTEGGKPSQLRVTITQRVGFGFGAAIGLSGGSITRTAVSDFSGPAPMGSPCNTFGNEPPSNLYSHLLKPFGAVLSSSVTTCAKDASTKTSYPKFWAAIEGPEVDKVQGDRYMTRPCASTSTYACASGKNSEHRPEGYFWAVHVEPAAVGKPIDVQLYDPAFIYTQVDCSAIANLTSGLTNSLGLTINLNTVLANIGLGSTPLFFNLKATGLVSEDLLRYAGIANIYCSGDYFPGGTGEAPTTSFTMREQTATGDPMKAPVINGCTRQYRGYSTAPGSSALRPLNNTSFNGELSRVFHQWVSLCTFTPTRAGDYYLQVRTNVKLPTTGAVANVNASGRVFDSVEFQGNVKVGLSVGDTDKGKGLNAFGIRAVTSDPTLRDQVAVAGFYRMPILQNAPNSVAKFHMIRAASNTKGQYIEFDFFDAGDGTGTTGGTVKVIPPADATGSIKTTAGMSKCRGQLGNGSFVGLTNCTVNIKNSTHNGQVQAVIIPIPDDYACADTKNGRPDGQVNLAGCWFQVEIDFKNSDVTDFTTWDANIGGDPVRLIE